ncbi:MAG: hypothetical protein WC758_04825 [Candidatus Woesearchaeota archaeon]|jgi:hypothetical protein
MGDKINTVDQNQLYNLFSKYVNYVDNSDERGLIIGYSVLEALLKHKPNSNSEEERVFEEVKAIYTKLKKDLDSLLNNDPLRVLNDLKYEVDLQLKKTESSSKILTEFLPTLNRKKNPTEYIRNVGLKIQTLSKDKGTFVGTRNILLNDYNTLKETYR